MVFHGDESNKNTKLCRRWQAGYCGFGARCNFAHHVSELRPRTKSSSTSTSTSSGIGTMGIHGIGISTNPLQDALSGFSSPRSSSPITEGGSSPPSDDGSSMSSSSSFSGNLAAMAPTPEKSLQRYRPPPPDSPPIALKGMQHSESTRQLPATMEEVQKALPQSAMPEPEQMLTIRTFPSV